MIAKVILTGKTQWRSGNQTLIIARAKAEPSRYEPVGTSAGVKENETDSYESLKVVLKFTNASHKLIASRYHVKRSKATHQPSPKPFRKISLSSSD